MRGAGLKIGSLQTSSHLLPCAAVSDTEAVASFVCVGGRGSKLPMNRGCSSISWQQQGEQVLLGSWLLSRLPTCTSTHLHSTTPSSPAATFNEDNALSIRPLEDPVHLPNFSCCLILPTFSWCQLQSPRKLMGSSAHGEPA